MTTATTPASARSSRTRSTVEDGGVPVRAIPSSVQGRCCTPRSRPIHYEDERLGPVVGTVKEQAREVRSEADERAKQVAQAATETAKEVGQQHADELRESMTSTSS